MALGLVAQLFVLLSIVVNITIIYFVLRTREQANMKLTWYLIATIISVIIWIISVYLEENFFPYYPDQNTDVMLEFAILAAISNVSIITGLLLVSIFIKFLVNPELDLSQTSFLISIDVLIAGYYMILLYSSIEENKDLFELTFALINLFNLIFVATVLYFARKDVIELKNSIADIAKAKLQRQINYLNLGLHISLIFIIPLLFIGNFVNRQAIVLTFAVITISFGFIAYAYQLDPRVAYVLPERTYLAIVVNTHGVLRYSRDFAGDADKDDAVLISGALNAVTSLMSEFYDSVVTPAMIEFEEKLILFRWSENYFLAVFSDRDSKLIRNAMDKTINQINSKYDDIEKTMQASRVLDLDEVFDKTFYFVYN